MSVKYLKSGFDYNRLHQAIPPKKIGIFLFDGMEPMDYMGPMCVFDAWSEIRKGTPEVVTFSHKKSTVCDYGRTYQAQASMDEVSDLDALFVPGGRGRASVVQNQVVLKKLRSLGEGSDYLLSVCTGSFILNAAGLIVNNTVTTHHHRIQELRDVSTLNVIEDASVVTDGNVWTGGGVFCGSRMSLAFVKSFEGYPLKDGTMNGESYRDILSDIQHDDCFNDEFL